MSAVILHNVKGRRINIVEKPPSGLTGSDRKCKRGKKINTALRKLSFTRATFFAAQTPTWCRRRPKLSDAFLNLITPVAL